jgi:hypothetical protein
MNRGDHNEGAVATGKGGEAAVPDERSATAVQVRVQLVKDFDFGAGLDTSLERLTAYSQLQQLSLTTVTIHQLPSLCLGGTTQQSSMFRLICLQ